MLKTVRAGVVLSAIVLTAPAPSLAAQNLLAPGNRLQQRIEAAYTAEISPALLPDGVERTRELYQEARRDRRLPLADRAKATMLYANAIWETGDGKAPLALMIETVESLKAARQDDTELMAQALKYQSIFQTGTGDVAGSLVTKQQALVLMRRHHGDNSPEVGLLLCSMAHAYSLLGRLDDALNAYENGLGLMRTDFQPDGKHRDPANYSAYLGNYAGQLRVAGAPETSLAVSREALQVAYQMPEGDRAVSWGMFNMASSLLDLGRFAEAETLYRQALDYSVKHGGKVSYETGSYTHSLGRVLARQGKIEEAEAMLQTAVSIFEQVPTGSSPYLLGVSLGTLGQLAYERGDFALAETRLNKSLDVLVGLNARSRPQTANTRSDLALALLARNALPEALEQVDLALVYYRAEKPLHEKNRVSAETLRALILARQGKNNMAAHEAAMVAAAMESRLNSLSATAGEHADTALLYGRSFTRVAEVALIANQPELGFRAAQLAAFTEVAATSQTLAAQSAIADPKAREWVESLETLRRKRQQLDRARIFATGKSQDDVTRLDGEIATIDIALTAVDGRLADAFPQYKALSRPVPATISQAQTALGAKSALILPLSGDDRTTSLVLTRKGMSWDQTMRSRIAFDALVHRIRASVETQDDHTAFDRAAAYELGQAVFPAKIMASLRGMQDVEIVGAGPVMTVPFGLLIGTNPKGRDEDPEALRDTDWLIRAFAFSVRPALVAAAERGGRTEAGAFAGIGAPSGTPSDTSLLVRSAAVWPLPQLPHAEAELRRMESALNLPGSVVLTGSEATEARLRALPLARYSVIAFATHGLVSGDIQTLREPALVMTPPAGSGDDGLLTASEIATFRLDADWIILSACNTGTGREAGAAGYSGLAKAFLQAGGRNVLVSLWPVRDDAASAISVGTVQAYAKGDSEARALRRAMLRLIKDKTVAGSAHPRVWAPFSVVTR